ncbi:MAG: YqgE/AlgH family protein, partial [Flavobacteriales bacterium]|nr:YqgE/AlgH family protein [Flavobacteriales bacterium]
MKSGFFIGYSGWDYDQLAKEIETESWIISDLNSTKISDLNSLDLWQ